MKRLAKILAALLGLIVVLVVVAAIALPLLFDPNEHKSEITALIEQKIGRDVTIPGEIDLSVFPWLGISIGEVTVANGPGFGDEPLAEIASAEIRVKLLPLLQKKIEIGTVSLNGLRLRLARNAEGRTNWAGIVEHMSTTDTSKPAEKKPAETKQEGSGFELTSLEIGSVVISDAMVSWNDAMAGNSYQLSDFHLTTGALTEDQPFKLQMGAVLAAATQGVTSNITLSTMVHPDISEGVYRVTDLQFEVQAEGDAVPGGAQDLTLTGQGVYNLAAGQFKIGSLHIQAAGLDVTGQVSGKGLGQAPAFSGSFDVAQFDPRAVLGNLGMAVPELQGEQTLSSAGMKVAFSATPSSAQISELRIALDDSVFTGTASVRDFASPAIAFNANVDAFNLDHYLPAGSAQETAEQPVESGKGDKSQTTTSIDLSFLKGLTLDGQLHVGKLTAYNMTFNDAKLAVVARDGVLTIKPLASGFYDGNIKVVARVDASGEVPQYSLQASLAQLKFAPLLQDLVGTDLVSALASLKLDLTSQGGTVNAIKQALDGTISFDLSDGTFHGFNLANLIAAARSHLTGGGAAPTESGGETPFNRFAGTFNINNGTLSGDGLTLDTRYLGAIGAGKYNLVANNLDYTLKVQVDEKDAGPLSEVAGLMVPIHLGGSLFAPDYSIDVAAALKGLAQQHLQEEKAELKKKIKEEKAELKDKLQQKLSEELGGKDSGKDSGKLEKKLQEGLSNLFGN